LTCRSTLSSARRELYRDPFRVPVISRWPLPGLFDWSRAAPLLRTLRRCPNLAAVVKDLGDMGLVLDGIVEAGLDLQSPSAALTPLDWHKALLELCPNVYNVSCCLVDVERARDLSKLVATRSKVDLLSIRFAGDEDKHEIFVAWMEAFDSERSPRWQFLLEFDDVLDQTPFDTPRLPYSATSIHLGTYVSSLSRTVPLLPLDITGLTRLWISFSSEYGETDRQIHTFLSVFANNSIKELEITTNSIPYEWDELSYAETQDGTGNLPLAFFSTFPHLEVLRLEGVGGLSVDKLSLLATTAPSLNYLDLSLSLWDLEAEDLEPPNSGPFQDLVGVLERLPELTYADLGVFPYFKEDEERPVGLEELEEYCEGREVKLRVGGLDDDF
jgi:hypothetical protein